MFIKKYKYKGITEDKWNFDEVEFSKVNLFVGDSATGKTRLFNTIFNLGSYVASDEIFSGSWDMEFVHNGVDYRWQFEASKVEETEEKGRVIFEKLWKKTENGDRLLVDRNEEKFIFLGDKELPKLSASITSISLLKEEAEIAPAHEGFERILRRQFFLDELKNASNLTAISPNFIKKIEKSKSLKDLYRSGLTLNAQLYILDKYFHEIFNIITDHYKALFPFIKETRVLSLNEIARHVGFASDIPVFCIREREVGDWIPISQISSGMQKVLLIITDILAFPEGGLYMIDEYENSLGVTPINFLPELIYSLEKEMQYFIISHHPYLINEIPPSDWYVFHRKGNQVSIKYGKELEERFGKSSQQAFIQLINDPFYTEGIE